MASKRNSLKPEPPRLNNTVLSSDEEGESSPKQELRNMGKSKGKSPTKQGPKSGNKDDRGETNAGEGGTVQPGTSGPDLGDVNWRKETLICLAAVVLSVIFSLCAVYMWSQLGNQVSPTAKDLAELRSDMMTEVSEINRRSDALEREVADIKRQLQSKEHEVQELREEVKSLKVNDEKVSRKMQQLQREGDERRKDDQTRFKKWEERCTATEKETVKLKEEHLKQQHEEEQRREDDHNRWKKWEERCTATKTETVKLKEEHLKQQQEEEQRREDNRWKKCEERCTATEKEIVKLKEEHTKQQQEEEQRREDDHNLWKKSEERCTATEKETVKLKEEHTKQQQEEEQRRKEDQNRLQKSEERCVEAEKKCREETFKLREVGKKVDNSTSQFENLSDKSILTNDTQPNVNQRLVLLETANGFLVRDVKALRSDLNKTKRNVTATVRELKEEITYESVPDRTTTDLIGRYVIGAIFIFLFCFIVWAEWRRRQLCKIIYAN